MRTTRQRGVHVAESNGELTGADSGSRYPRGFQHSHWSALRLSPASYPISAIYRPPVTRPSTPYPSSGAN